MESAEVVLDITDVSKRYGGVEALKNVSFMAHRRSIHAIVGENGAGKSTLMKIIAGVTLPNTGTIVCNGKTVRFSSPLDAMKSSIFCVFQELSIVPDLTVAENICIVPGLSGSRAFESTRQKIRRSEEVLARMKCEDLNPREPCTNLSLPRLQLVEIAKAVVNSPSILILDEATSALSAGDAEKVFALLRRLRDDGISILYITHHLREVEVLADTCSVFRNGQRVESFAVGSRSQDEIVRMMIGRPISKLFPEKGRPVTPPVVNLDVRNLGWYGKLHDISFSVHRGEIVGLGGIEGQGQKELLFSLFGVLKNVKARVELGGRPLSLKSPAALVRSTNSIVMIPEDRKSEGLFTTMSILKNVSISALRRFVSGPFINTQKETEAVTGILHELHTKIGSIHDAIDSLSGGNQQKVILAKWLLLDASCLLLMDPTRGIDLATKQEIYVLLRDLANRGTSILLYTTDYDELIGLCDRVMIMSKGRIKTTLVGSEITDNNILVASLDLKQPGAPQRPEGDPS